MRAGGWFSPGHSSTALGALAVARVSRDLWKLCAGERWETATCSYLHAAETKGLESFRLCRELSKHSPGQFQNELPRLEPELYSLLLLCHRSTDVGESR